MDNRDYRKYQQSREEYLKAAEHAYVFRPESGLHEPKSLHPEEERQHVAPGASPAAPFFVHTWTDWGPPIVAGIISIITLGIIGWYTYVTQGILDTSRRANDNAWSLTNCTNRVAINAERPWMGITLGAAPDLAPNISEVVVYYTNSGRRPAAVYSTDFYNHEYAEFPVDPYYGERDPGNLQVKGTGIVVPNAVLTNSQPFQKLTPKRIAHLKSIKEHFFIYAKIEYKDTLTQATHFTHACWEYLPGFHNVGGGFVNCESYNEVDPEPDQETCQPQTQQ